MGAVYTALLFYCNSKWLSKGNVLIRAFDHFNKFINSDFVIKLTYLIVTHLIFSTHLYMIKKLVLCNYIIKLLLLFKKIDL